MSKLQNLSVQDLANGLSRVSGKCRFIGVDYQCDVPTDGLHQWLAGLSIQRAMPTVSADDREFLMSGISPKGWEEKFGKH